MKTMEKFELWQEKVGEFYETPTITYYKPEKQTGDGAVIIFPGGGYGCRAPYEGDGYARFLSANGVASFVVDYRVAPSHYPDPLSDARRAVRFVRHYAQKFQVNKDKIAVMGSSAGGHLTALVSTYRGEVAGDGIDEIGQESPFPNAQILCYPVISSDLDITHLGTYTNLLGEDSSIWEQYNPEKLVTEKAPLAFIWHTSEDNLVNVINSYAYAQALKKAGVACEMHIFPYGVHGLGVSEKDAHVAQWTGLLLNWLKLIGF